MMNGNRAWFQSLSIGFYAWIITIFFGGVCLDIIYEDLINDVLSASVRQAVFSEVSDVLLLLGSLTVIAAISAIVFSWRASAVRNLLIASLMIVMLEYFPFIQILEHLGVGAWLRLIPSGLGSILAFFGLFFYFRQ